MKFALARTKKFKKSYKKLHLRDRDEAVYIDVVSKLLNGVALDEKHKDHSLRGTYGQYRECHLKPNLLLIYRHYRKEVQLIDIGSHAELFE